MKIALNRNFALWMFVGMIGFMAATLLVPGLLVKKNPQIPSTLEALRSSVREYPGCRETGAYSCVQKPNP